MAVPGRPLLATSLITAKGDNDHWVCLWKVDRAYTALREYKVSASHHLHHGWRLALSVAATGCVEPGCGMVYKQRRCALIFQKNEFRSIFLRSMESLVDFRYCFSSQVERKVIVDIDGELAIRKIFCFNWYSFTDKYNIYPS